MSTHEFFVNLNLFQKICTPWWTQSKVQCICYFLGSTDPVTFIYKTRFGFMPFFICPIFNHSPILEFKIQHNILPINYLKILDLKPEIYCNITIGHSRHITSFGMQLSARVSSGPENSNCQFWKIDPAKINRNHVVLQFRKRGKQQLLPLI